MTQQTIAGDGLKLYGARAVSADCISGGSPLTIVGDEKRRRLFAIAKQAGNIYILRMPAGRRALLFYNMDVR